MNIKNIFASENCATILCFYFAFYKEEDGIMIIKRLKIVYNTNTCTTTSIYIFRTCSKYSH